ncbi:MAG: DNA ligase D [Luteolibacter sp.]|uniref:DNA ligase D n=1 Tax=Luteolibacter sp. TaxID=1962973 RepID=UPI003266BF72
MPARKSPPKKAVAPLDRYRDKRDFKKTPEPGVKVARRAGNSFVVQEHHARSHHFDFRLEMDGVLVSWAVPKGIPEEASAKRLAVHVEDHPLDYGGFEGVIPAGNYGAGKVAIWDKGTWEPLEKDWRKKFGKGKLKFILKGRRLEGVYLLAKMGEEPNWLMRKLEVDLPAEPSPKAEREEAKFVSPQLARVVPSVPSGNQWLHEIKFDGYRLIAVKNKGGLRLFTRSGLDWTDRFGTLAKQLSGLTKHDFVIDGEAVVFDAKGRSSFGELQAALQAGGQDKIEFVAFDLLNFNGYNLRNQPLSDRLRELAKIVADDGGPIRLSKVWPAGKGNDLFKQACASGLEGIISKNSSGRYIEGSRRDWAKSKCRARQEFVICGYTPPKGSLPAFGALVLGSFENGRLVPRGKVGTGFSERDRERLLKVFKTMPARKAAFDFKEASVTWIEPKLVAEIEFAEITRDGSIRQGSFTGLREDKSAADVHLDPLQTAVAAGKEAKVAGIAISHPERLVYPDDQITKLEVARYYERVGDMMLPFVANRPLSILRAPGGLTDETFFQKSFPSHIPPHVFQKVLDDGTTVFSIRDTKGLVALAQFGVIEFHLWGAPLPKADKPDFLIWDLDPDPTVPWPDVLGAALLTRDYLQELGLSTVVKTSGGKGLHIVLHTKKSYQWQLMRDFTKAVAQEIAAYNPKRFITTSTKAKRAGKIFIDWMRNGRGATCVAPWSLRARKAAPVSMPINWADLRESTAAGFTIREPSPPPSEWESLKAQTITKSNLRKLGLI